MSDSQESRLLTFQDSENLAQVQCQDTIIPRTLAKAPTIERCI